MDVLGEILTWSTSRPPWQRDALRRIVREASMSDDDIADLAELCKASHGLSAHRQAVPLTADHVRGLTRETNAVTLSSLTHMGGVNALASGQRIDFDPRLTVIFGENAAGKSGYTRILKSACRARGAEEILGNCLDDSMPDPPKARLVGRSGDDEFEFNWTDDSPP